MRELESVVLTVEELEALRLSDLEGLYQEDAALRMDVSRQTFQRVLREARRKIAEALVAGKAVGIEGGDYVLAGEVRLFECLQCGHAWEEPHGTGVRACEASCPECGGRVARLGCGRGPGAPRGKGPRGRWGHAAGAARQYSSGSGAA